MITVIFENPPLEILLPQYEKESIMEFIIDHHLFKGLSEETLNFLYSRARPLKIKRGVVLTKEGEKNRGFYLLRHGVVKVVRYRTNSKEVILWLAGTGDCPGIDSLFCSDLYKTTSVAVKESFAYFITKRAFDELVQKNPSVSVEMMKYISGKIDDLETRIYNMNKKRRSSSFADILSTLDSRRGSKNLIPDLLSIDEIASLLGSDKRYVYALINQLAEKNIVSFDDGILEILNAKALKDMAA